MDADAGTLKLVLVAYVVRAGAFLDAGDPFREWDFIKGVD